MKWIDSPGLPIPYYTFENLERTNLTINAFTTRRYCKDGEMQNFLQLLLRADSNPEEVAYCKDLLFQQFQIDAEHLVPSAQKHTANIHLVTERDLGPVSERTPLKEVDGLITNRPGVMLQTFGADCPSVYLLDPVQKAIGLCHSGRKGTQYHIAAVMLDRMSREFATNPKDVLAAISPGICADCYEVGDDVAEDFVLDYLRHEKTAPDLAAAGVAEAFSHPLIRSLIHQVKGRYYLDLPGAIRHALIDAGVPNEQIESSPLCTKCRGDLFFSFRKEGRITNENCALFLLK